MFGVGNQDSLNTIMKGGEWVDYTIKCQDNRIQIWVNGFNTIDYYEEDNEIENNVIICLQIHGRKDHS